MRIIHFSHCDLGGTEASTAHVMEFANGLQKRGHRVHVVSPAKSTPYPEPTDCEMTYFPFIRIKGFRQMTAIFSGFITLLRLKIKWKPDCLYIRRLVLDPMPGIFAWISRTPMITETNGQIEVHRYEFPASGLWTVFWYPLLLLFERILFSNSFAVTADGEQRLARFKNRYPQLGTEFQMIRSGGIDLDRFCPRNKVEARKELGLPQGRRLLIWVGTFFDFSGLEILINTAPMICRQNDSVDFLIIGDGPNKRHFVQLAKERGILHRMRFTGYIQNSDLYKWLSASDLALAPYNKLRLSREDFTSYKIFEYLACGLPVVTSFVRGGSNIHYIHKYNLGAAVPPEDEEAFANAVLQVLSKETFFTDEFAQASRRTLKKLNVSWAALVGQVEKLCRAAVKSNQLRIH